MRAAAPTLEPPIPLKQSSPRRSWLLMVLVALALRLVVAGFLYPERLNPERDHWRFAGETGHIARSIVEGRGFSSPLRAESGPTAWMTPIFPYILAGVFRIFGVYTKASDLAALALDSLFSALTCIPIFFVARKSFGPRTAMWAGWAWAFFPYAIYFSADVIWATTLTTLMLALIFWAALVLDEARGRSAWIGFGLLCGIAALIDPVVLSVGPPLALWMLYRRYGRHEPWFAHGMAAAIAFLIVVSPWFVRNYRALHAFVPFRDNFGLELYVGNNGQTWHFAPGGFHPSDTEKEWHEYQQVGELNYMRHKQQQAMAYIEGHPGQFVVLCLRRAGYMWTNYWSFSKRYLQAEPLDPENIFLCTALTVLALIGLRRAFQRSGAVAVPYAIALFFFPVVYYITHPEDYYRRPIDPIFVILAAYALVAIFSKKRPETPCADS